MDGHLASRTGREAPLHLASFLTSQKWSEDAPLFLTSQKWSEEPVVSRADAYPQPSLRPPRLAGPEHLQPVVYIVAQDADLYAIPLASSIDRFFELSSRYLERMVANPESRGNWSPEVRFPWDMGDEIVRDGALVEQVRRGHFDFLTNEYEGALRWLERLRTGTD